MTLAHRWPRLAWRVIRVLIPLLVSAALLGVLAFGYGPVPRSARPSIPAAASGPRHPAPRCRSPAR